MNSISTFTIDNFRFGSWRIFRDAANQKVQISSGSEFEGYLVYDSRSKQYAQIRFARAVEGFALVELLEYCNQSSFELLPKILQIGEVDSVPFYICELPSGESVHSFLNSKGAIPVESAVLLMLDFVKTLIETESNLPNELAFHPHSMWVCRSKGNPRIQLGDINRMSSNSPLQHNLRVCADLLRYMTEDAKKVEFQELCEFIAKQATSYQEVVQRLLSFSDSNPAANFWMGYNDPACIIERVKPLGYGEPDKESALLEAARKNAWPLVATLTVIVMALLFSLNFMFRTPAPKEVVVGRKKPAQLTPKKRSVKPVESSDTDYSQSADDESVVASPEPTNSSTAELVEVQASGDQAETDSLADLQPVDIDPNSLSPELRKTLIETGLFNDLLAEPVYDWMVEGVEEVRVNTKQQIAEQQALAHLENSSLIAKQRNDIFNAVSIELAVLKIAPSSIQSRVRLHNYLSEIKNNIAKAKIDENRKAVLVEASAQNALAREILVLHQNKQSFQDSSLSPDHSLLR